jgi:iron(III) transport system permease protein
VTVAAAPVGRTAVAPPAVARPDRRRAPGRVRRDVGTRRTAGWTATVGLVAAVVLAPIVALVTSVLRPEDAVWSHLWATRLPGQLLATVALTVTVTAFAAVIGTGAAWLVMAHRFPGRNLLLWLLALPLALPAYVAGFAWLDTLDAGGAAWRLWTGVAGADAWWPQVRSLPFAAMVLTLSLYPYVYLLAAAAFRDQAGGAVEAARTLGASRWTAFRRVALPTATPSIVAGSVLVALEVLTDVGTVRIFNVQTVADGVFRVWFGLADREAATELAGILLLAAALILGLERLLGRRRPVAGRGTATLQPVRLRGRTAAAALAAGSALATLALGLPLWRLVGWTAQAVAEDRTASVAGGVGHHIWSTVRVTAATMAICVTVGIVVALCRRWGRGRAGVLATTTTLGYGLPGPVVALGVLVCLAAVDRSGVLPRNTLLAGSFVGLVLALVVRYLALAVKPAEQGLNRAGHDADDAARMLGASTTRIVTRVQLPLARTGLVVAGSLVALDVVKELPATLLLRPFGIDTLPVWVWQTAGDSRWVEAGLPGLLIVAVAAVPTLVLVRLVMRGRDVSW